MPSNFERIQVANFTLNTAGPYSTVFWPFYGAEKILSVTDG